MLRRKFAKSKGMSCVIVALWVALPRLAGATPTLEEVAKGVNVDADRISVSGISSGGFMAHQFHVAHSAHVMGAGIVAGGPYYCARGSMLDAVTRCSSFAKLECTAMRSKLGSETKSCQKIDLAPKTENAESCASPRRRSARRGSRSRRRYRVSSRTLRTTSIYLFSGTYDAIVPQGVMGAVFHFYVDPTRLA